MLNTRSGLISAFILSVLLVCGCTTENPTREKARISTSLPVFASILDEIVGSDGPVHVLLKDGQSPHGYRPKPSDVRGTADSQILVLGDPDLDGWAEAFGGKETVYLSSLVGDDQWLVTEGVRNPHFWTDPVLIRDIAPAIATSLCGEDTDRCREYRENVVRFQADLDTLDARLSHDLSPLSNAVVVSSQPFMDYFLRRYSIKTIGSLEPIPGKEPTPARLVDLLQTAYDRDCIGILAQKKLPDVSARLFATESGLPIIYLDPVGPHDGHSYVSHIHESAQTILHLLSSGR